MVYQFKLVKHSGWLADRMKKFSRFCHGTNTNPWYFQRFWNREVLGHPCDHWKPNILFFKFGTQRHSDQPDISRYMELFKWWFQVLLFSPQTLGKNSNMTSIFFRWGWFNHQLKSGCWFETFVSPLSGEMVQFDSYFSNGLKPPTKICWLCIYYWLSEASLGPPVPGPKGHGLCESVRHHRHGGGGV